MKIIEHVSHLAPAGTDAYKSLVPDGPAPLAGPGAMPLPCPNWPPDLFAITGPMIEISGCYTQASPDRSDLSGHGDYLDSVYAAARAWNDDPFQAPDEVQERWPSLLTQYRQLSLASIGQHPAVVKHLLALFAIADQASLGIRWDVSSTPSALITGKTTLVNLCKQRPSHYW